MVSLSFFCAALLQAQPDPNGYPSAVTYTPQVKIVEGNQPLSQSYALSITSPSNLAANTPVTVALGLTVLSAPSGVAEADALSFISLNPASLSFTGPNQVLTTIVTVAVPLGNFAGDYAYRILPSGWPVTTNGITDTGATVNATISPPNSTDTSAPAIALLSPTDGMVYTYTPASGLPVTVPVNFSAVVGATGDPINAMVASLDTVPVSLTIPVSLTAAGLLTVSASATGSVQLTTPGSYTISVVATNRNGTSSASAGFSVVVNAPPPTITASSPASSSTFTYTLGTAGASVPVSFNATSIYGNITSLSATLDGSPIALSLSGVGSALTASASASLTVATTGAHSLVLSAANNYGSATPVTIPFNVASTAPAPTVSILTPVNGTTFNRVAGDPATIVNYTFQGGTAYGKITTVTVKLDGAPVTAAVVGLNSPSVSGSGSASFSAGGSHTLNVTVSNGGMTASASTTFTIKQTTPPVCENLTWLPPISLNKTVQGGSTVPIKFELSCHNRSVCDTSVLIAIYEIYANHTTSNPVIYPYGPGGNPNPPDYAITCNNYQLNFTTARGVHDYRVEVYTPASGVMQLLGSKDIYTNGQQGNGCQ